MRFVAVAAIMAIAIFTGTAGAQVNGQPPANGSAPMNADPQDAETLRNYELSMDKVRAYDAATRAFNAAANSDRRLQAEARAIFSAPQQSLANQAANFGRQPLILAYYSRQGLAALDAVVLPIVLSNACMADLYPRAAARNANVTSPGQIAFCRTHLREIEALPTFSGPPPPPQQ